MARDVFETNTLGTIAVTQAVLPGLRERRAGVIVNVTSSVTLRPLHLLSVYTASKAAVNAFTESLALELEECGRGWSSPVEPPIRPLARMPAPAWA